MFVCAIQTLLPVLQSNSFIYMLTERNQSCVDCTLSVGLSHGSCTDLTSLPSWVVPLLTGLELLCFSFVKKEKNNHLPKSTSAVSNVQLTHINHYLTLVSLLCSIQKPSTYSAQWFSVGTTECFTVYQKELSLPFFCSKSLVSLLKRSWIGKRKGCPWEWFILSFCSCH